MKTKIKYEEIILMVYPQLDKLSDNLEKSAYRQAVSSFYAHKSTFDSIEDILDTIKKRNNVVRLRNICNIVFSRMDNEELNLFSYKYFNVYPIANFDYSSRNYFRKQKRALEHFKELLGYIGLDEKVFCREYSFIPCPKAISQNKECKLKYNCPVTFQKKAA